MKDDYSIQISKEPLEISEKILFSREKTIITAGMLEPWKRQDDIIKAFNLIKNKIDANLIILGDGSQKENLKKLIEILNLKDSVFLVGNVKNPLKYFYNSDVFVLASSVEGLPNVLVESMMCGCTPVSTNCPTGPREVLQNEKYGYLSDIGDIKRISANIDKAIKFPISKDKLDEAILEFEEDKVIKRHFDLLKVN